MLDMLGAQCVGLRISVTLWMLPHGAVSGHPVSMRSYWVPRNEEKHAMHMLET